MCTIHSNIKAYSGDEGFFCSAFQEIGSRHEPADADRGACLHPSLHYVNMFTVYSSLKHIDPGVYHFQRPTRCHHDS